MSAKRKPMQMEIFFWLLETQEIGRKCLKIGCSCAILQLASKCLSYVKVYFLDLRLLREERRFFYVFFTYIAKKQLFFKVYFFVSVR